MLIQKRNSALAGTAHASSPRLLTEGLWVRFQVRARTWATGSILAPTGTCAGGNQSMLSLSHQSMFLSLPPHPTLSTLFENQRKKHPRVRIKNNNNKKKSIKK